MAKKTQNTVKKSKFDLDAIIRGLPPETAEQQPGIPVSTAKLEAQRLWKAAIKQRPLFAKLPDFDVSDLDTIPQRVAALESAQEAWLEARLEKHANSQAGTRSDAEKLRSALSAAARYLFRKNAKMQAVLDDIAHGDGLADLVDDLKRLADIAIKNRKLFDAAPKLPKGAAALALKLAASLEAGVDGSDADASLARRNQVYAVLELAVNEVREGARFLFHDEPRTLAPMMSHYQATLKRAQRNKKAQPAPAPNPTPAT